MPRSFLIIVFAILCVVNFFCSSLFTENTAQTKTRIISNLSVLPSPVAKAVTLEFSGLISDQLMLNTLSFLGKRIMERKTNTADEWNMVYQTLVQITNLDPRFIDPYLIAAMSLPWEAGMVEEANDLLLKAAKTLTDDYRPYFFLWYNYVTFLNDQERGGYYLQKAATKPGAPPYFKTLSARMNLYAGKIETGIIFLKECIKDTTDPLQQENLKRRLQALQKIRYLELKILDYRRKYKKKPAKLTELVGKGILTKIPSDPYGGKFYIMHDGRVYTTSELVFK